ANIISPTLVSPPSSTSCLQLYQLVAAMNGIAFPVQVALLFRRLVNVVSTLAVSKQYSLWDQRTVEEHEKQGTTDWNLTENKLGSSCAQSSSDSRSSTLLAPSPIVSQTSWTNLSFAAEPLGGYQSSLPSTTDRTLPPSRSPVPIPWPQPRKPSHEPSPNPPRSQNTDQPSRDPAELDIIHTLLANPALADPIRVPRYPIVLCHGLYGFDSRGPSSFPSMQIHYWSNVLNILRRKVGAEVIVTAVPGTGSIESRAEALDQQLQRKARGRGVNFLAHSMGGLDCRHLISHIKPTEYIPLSLTSVSTPHRGSPFMDWCSDNIGLGKLKREELVSRSVGEGNGFSLAQLPSSFVSLLLNVVDSPAYANLTTSFLNDVFNPQTPDDPRVKYFSVAARSSGASIWHPLWLPKLVLDGSEDKERERLRAAGLGREQRKEWGNDGLVTIDSARWGEFLGTMECDHWEIRGARGLELNVEIPAFEGLGFIDWGRFASAWKKEEKAQAAAATPEEVKDRADNALIRKSTETLSSVVDWLVDQVPVPLASKGKTMDESEDRVAADVAKLHGEVKTGKEKKERKAELVTKTDLERFYIALSRKMYDEGL
ncbi:unnamed protein product, partial [Mycena citricolor]